MKKTEPQHANPYARWYLTFILLFGICVVGVFLLYRAFPYPGGLTGSLYLWIFSMLTVAFIAAMLNLSVKDLHFRGKTRGILSDIAEEGVVRGLVRRIVRRQKRARGPAAFVISLAILTLVLVVVLFSNDFLFDHNMLLLGSFDLFRGVPPPSDSTACILPCYTMGRGTESRLRWILKVTEDLKRVGAKVVVIQLPPFVPRPYYPEIVERIRATGIVVFAEATELSKVGWKTSEYSGWELTRDSLHHPMGVLSAMPLTSTGNPTRMSIHGCFVPYGYIHREYEQTTDPPRQDTTSDVTLEVLRKWNDWPETVRPVRQGRNVLFGSYRIPVSEAGLTIVRPAEMRMLVTAGDDWEKDTSGYYGISHPAGAPAADLSEFEGEIRGKIVVLGHMGPDAGISQERWWKTMSCATVITSTLRQDFITVRADLDIWLTLLVSVISCYVVLRFRPMLSFLTLLCFTLLIATVSVWLYHYSAMAIQVVYPLVGLALNMVILPLARISSDVARDERTRSSEASHATEPA